MIKIDTRRYEKSKHINNTSIIVEETERAVKNSTPQNTQTQLVSWHKDFKSLKDRKLQWYLNCSRKKVNFYRKKVIN